MMKNRIMMKSIKGKKYIVLFIFLCMGFGLISCDRQASSTELPPIIPLPNNIELQDGVFTLNENTEIIYSDESFSEKAVFLQKSILEETGLKLTIKYSSESKSNSIFLQKNTGYSKEEYALEVKKNKIICDASEDAGIHYCIESLVQSLTKKNKDYTIPCLTIKDKPHYEWRGLMLDEARHFHGKETVMQYLGIMSKLKLNRFHWHLTDEQAWRIEIKKYPLLTEIGAEGSWSDRNAEAKFYTQEDIIEIVEYASSLNIMVIPEIDMPGHATAASRAYPEVSGGGEGKWKGFTFHPAKESTYEFIDNVFTEIAELFPAPYIHIGGDEVHYGNQSWFKDPIIQSFIKKHDLKNEIGMEHYFVRRISEIVASRGKIMLGWDEIINAGISPENAIALWWHHDKPEILTQALDKNFKVIMCPRIPCYFDFVQDESHKIGRRWEGNYNYLSRVYHFPDSITDIIKGRENQIVGLQANVFSERIIDKKRLDYMIFPRLLAISEDGWTNPENKDYANFEDRVKKFMVYLERLNINYFNPFDKEKTPEPWGPDKEDPIAEG